MKKTHGFTLVEVMVSVLVGAVILEAIYTMVLIGQKSWNDYANNLVPKEEMRRGLISMVSELREAQNFKINDDPRKASISFERPMVGDITYSWSSSGENANELIRTINHQTRVLAKDIASVSFSSPEDNEIIVSLKGGKNKELVLKEQIALRSKTGLFLQGENEAVK